MKTSEFIREAVDKYLLAKLEKPSDCEDTEVYLCYCIKRYAAFCNMPTDRGLAQKIQDEIHEFIQLERKRYGWTAPHSMHAFPDMLYNPKNQEIRFMFAEFLALMFEDEGD